MHKLKKLFILQVAMALFTSGFASYGYFRNLPGGKTEVAWVSLKKSLIDEGHFPPSNLLIDAIDKFIILLHSEITMFYASTLSASVVLFYTGIAGLILIARNDKKEMNPQSE